MDERELSDWVVLTKAPTIFEAEVLVAVLEDAGISVQHNETLLQDGFAASQRAMGNLEVAIRVPAAEVEAARAAIAKAQSKGKSLLKDDPEVES